MQTVILIIHIILAVFLVGLVLLQRSEGGALGGLGGGTGASFMTGRAVGNMLTKMTSIVAALFVVTSLTLGILAKQEVKTESLLTNLPVQTSVPVQEPVSIPTPAAVPTDSAQ